MLTSFTPHPLSEDFEYLFLSVPSRGYAVVDQQTGEVTLPHTVKGVHTMLRRKSTGAVKLFYSPTTHDAVEQYERHLQGLTEDLLLQWFESKKQSKEEKKAAKAAKKAAEDAGQEAPQA